MKIFLAQFLNNLSMKLKGGVKMKNFKKTTTLLILLFFLISSFGFSATKASAKKRSQNYSRVKAVSKIVNINTAGISELVSLPRIGKKIAERIVKFRKKNGRFKRIEDLMKVKGIGEKTFNRIKKRLKV